MRRPPGELPAVIGVTPVSKAFAVRVRPPGSKSLTNRALLLAAMATGESVISGALKEADDAVQMRRAVERMGAAVRENGSGTWHVRGVGGRWRVTPEGVTLNINNAGTAARFLAAAAMLSP